MDAALQGHALVVAGPGTGKTFILEVIARALESDGIPEHEVAVVTLTRAMAATLAQRIPHGRASTLHSFALYHLNRLAAVWARRVADNWEEENLVYGDIQIGVHEHFGYRPRRRDVAEFFRRMGSAFRDNQQEPAELSEGERRLLMVFRQHQQLFRYCLMDELVFDLVRLVEHGAQLNPLPRYTAVDEYQDLTPGELKLLQLLAQRGAAVVVCGDDRQSIYGFREADPLALHRFPEVYGVPPRYLWRSRRCPRRVCEFAEAVASILPPLGGGVDRPSLEPWPGRQDAGEVRIINAPSPIGEARWVVRECARLVEEGLARPEQIMVVVAFYFEPVFDNLVKAANEVGGLPFTFYDPTTVHPAAADKAVRLLGAGARLLVDNHDQMAWRTLVWATPQLGAGRLREILTADRGDFLRNLEDVATRDRACARALTAGLTLVERFQQQDHVEAREIVEHLRAELGIRDLDLSWLPVLNEAETRAEPETWTQAVVELSQKILVDPGSRQGEIPVRTIFGAKGLEAEAVFLINALEQSFTGRGSVADGVRRLFVAVTRAKQRVYVSAPRNLRGDRLAHIIGTRTSGIADIVTTSAARAAIPITRLG